MYHIGDSFHKVISLVSRCLTSAEVRYTTTEKEFLAVVYSVEQLRMYLIGREFSIVTDHHAPIFLTASPLHTSRLARWNLYLQEYTFNIEHFRGLDNVLDDFFSRHLDARFHIQRSIKFTLSRCNEKHVSYPMGNLLVSLKYLELSRKVKRHLKDIRK